VTIKVESINEGDKSGFAIGIGTTHLEVDPGKWWTYACDSEIVWNANGKEFM